MNGWAIFLFIFILVIVILVTICIILNTSSSPVNVVPPPAPPLPKINVAPTVITGLGIDFLPLNLTSQGDALVIKVNSHGSGHRKSIRSATTIGGLIVKLSDDGFKIIYGDKKYKVSIEFEKLVFIGSLYGLSCGAVYKITLGKNASVEEVNNLHVSETVSNIYRFGPHFVIETISYINVYSFVKTAASDLCLVSVFRNEMYNILGFINGYLFVKSYKGYFLIGKDCSAQINGLPHGIKSTTSLDITTGLNKVNTLFYSTISIQESDVNLIIITHGKQ